jgi:hypothetical protein
MLHFAARRTINRPQDWNPAARAALPQLKAPATAGGDRRNRLSHQAAEPQKLRAAEHALTCLLTNKLKHVPQGAITT